jgi:hypothetical protein
MSEDDAPPIMRVGEPSAEAPPAADFVEDVKDESSAEGEAAAAPSVTMVDEGGDMPAITDGGAEAQAVEPEDEGLLSDWGFSAQPDEGEGADAAAPGDTAAAAAEDGTTVVEGQEEADADADADPDAAFAATDPSDNAEGDETVDADAQGGAVDGAEEGDDALPVDQEEADYEAAFAAAQADGDAAEAEDGLDKEDDYEAAFAAAQAEGDDDEAGEGSEGEGDRDYYDEEGDEDDSFSNEYGGSQDLEHESMFAMQQDEDEEEDEHKRLLEDLQQANEENDHLLQIYKEREKSILQALARGVGITHSSAEEKINSAQIQNQDQMKLQYFKLLEDLNKLWDSLDSKRQDAERRIDRLTVKLDREDEKATELSDAFKKFKREISKEARFSRNGKPLKLKRILAFEDSEAAKDKEVATVRLKHITLVNQVRQLEEKVKQKEELAEGLHMIDFEQLKIENQTLNEKIEERNDDLHKLRKKTTTTVQVLTHIKEKLHFVENANGVLEGEMGELDMHVTDLRDRLTRAKQQRDSLRSENVKLKQKQGFIGSDLLVGDFEMRKETLTVTRERVAGLQGKHARMTALVHRAKKAEDAYNNLVQHQQRPGFHPRDPRASTRQETPVFR